MVHPLYLTRFTGFCFAHEVTEGGTIRHSLAYAITNVSDGGMMAATLDEAQLSGRTTRIGEEFSFPGRWLGGLSLIVAPLIFLTGILLRLPFRFFFPYQLTAFDQHSMLMTAAYNCFWAGNILLWPAVLTITQKIGRSKPRWAAWGGAFVLFGLFARTFHAGADHLAFQLVRIEGVDRATKAIAASYGAFHIVSALSATIMIGWILLAIGGYLSGTFGLLRSVGLGLMSALMLGVLKGSSITSVVAATGLCFAMVPLGIEVLLAPPRPDFRSVLKTMAVGIVLLVLLFVSGRLG